MIGLLTVVVCLAVLLVLRSVPAGAATGAGPSTLATLNAVLNGTAALLLCAGYVFIRRGQRTAHRNAMLGAFSVSCFFLVTYLLHHAQVGSVAFQGEGWLRTVYFTLLIPHVVLAAGIVPLALTTVYRAWTGRLAAHRRIARWTLPLWLYVSVSGVLIYWMLYHL